MNNRHLIVSDLDGTILPSGGEIHPETLDFFAKWQQNGHVTAIATGRNFMSLRKSLSLNAPFDFVICSSGQGIVCWPSQLLIPLQEFNSTNVGEIVHVLEKLPYGYMLHLPLPQHHRFIAREPADSKAAADFYRRLNIYAKEHTLYSRSEKIPETAASQFIIVLGPEDCPESLISQLQLKLKFCTVIRATSPLDASSHWIEIFPKGIGKGSASEILRQRLEIIEANTCGIGNDWNDQQLLAWANHPFVMNDSPALLKDSFEALDLLGPFGILRRLDAILC